MKQEKVQILGAGISGMVAAITLAGHEYGVEVFERRSRVGSFFERSVHSLRNYLYDSDVIEEYRGLGVKIPRVYPVFRQFRYSPSLKRVEIWSDSRPLFYNFLRGYMDNRSLDVGLYNTAREMGVEFCFDSSVSEDEARIVATGARRIKGVGYGEYYSEVPGEFLSANHIFLNNLYSPKGYSCILPFGDHAAIILGSTEEDTRQSLQSRFDRLKRDNPIVRHIVQSAEFRNEIYGFISYESPRTVEKGGIMFTGEAAGFLDAATAFGTHYAVLSGYLAAKAIIDRKPYDRMCDELFGDELARQYAKRMKLEEFSNEDHEREIESLIRNYGTKISMSDYRRIHLRS